MLSLPQATTEHSTYFEKTLRFLTEKPDSKERKMVWDIATQEKTSTLFLKRKEDSSKPKSKKSKIKIAHDRNFFKNLKVVARSNQSNNNE